MGVARVGHAVLWAHTLTQADALRPPTVSLMDPMRAVRSVRVVHPFPAGGMHPPAPTRVVPTMMRCGRVPPLTRLAGSRQGNRGQQKDHGENGRGADQARAGHEPPIGCAGRLPGFFTHFLDG